MSTINKQRSLIFSLILAIMLSSPQVKARIIPHPQFPVSVSVPHVGKFMDVILKFSLNSLNFESSETLQYGNYLAVKFGSYASTNFDISSLDDSNKTKFNCHLVDVNGISYKVVPSHTILSPLDSSVTDLENNIAYCRFIDTSKSIPTNVMLSLTISFNYKFESSSIYHNLSLLITTANHKDRIILDSLPSFGTFYLDYEFNSESVDDTAALQITSIDITTSSRTCGLPCKIYPYDTIQMTLEFEAMTYIDLLNLNNIIIQLDADLFDITDNTVDILLNIVDSGNPVLVSSDSDIELAVYNNFSYDNSKEYNYINTLNMFSADANSYSNNKIQLKLINIGENLVENRKFSITLEGLIVKPKLINTESYVEAIVYNKNSYSILSYHKPELPITINSISIGNSKSDPSFTGISHPDYINIYQSSAWPIRFIFYPQTVSINQGVWIVIQQSNTSSSSQFNFIASTCDFSATTAGSTIIDNDYTKRPICYPLRTDFNYENASTSTDYIGSGVFFKMDSFLITKNYSVTIWGYADVCGEKQLQTISNVVQYPNPLGSERTKAYTTFKFNYSAYISINSNNNNSNDESNIKEIRKLIRSAYYNKKSTSDISDKPSEKLINYSVYSNYTFGEGRFSNLVKVGSGDDIEMEGICYGTVISGFSKPDSFADLYSKVTLNANTLNGSDMLLYKEFTDIHLGRKANETTCTDCYMSDVNSVSSESVTIEDFQKYYIFSSESVEQDLNFFYLKSDSTFIKYDPIADYLPLPLYIDEQNKYQRQIGHIEFYFNSLFFANSAASNCYISWALKNGRSNDAIKQSNLFNVFSNDSYSDNLILNDPNGTLTTISSATYGVSGYQDLSINLGSKNIITGVENNNYSLTSDISTDYKLFIDTLIAETKPSTGSRILEESNKSHSSNNRLLQTTEADSFSLNFFSTCIKLITIPSAVRSIFAFIDFHVYWKTKSEYQPDGEVNRVMRFVKLYPEANVFHCVDSSCTTSKLKTVTEGYYFHFGYGPAYKTSQNSGVCIIEISKNLFTSITSNTIYFFLNNLILIDTDFTVATSTYPVGPLVNSNAYAFNSALSKSSKNHYHKMKYTDTSGESPVTYSLYDYKYVSLTSSSYHFYLAPYILIQGFSNSKVTSSSSIQENLLIPVLCPTYYDDNNGFPEIDIRISTIYLTATGHNSITELTQIAGNKATVSDSTWFNFSIKKETSYRGNGLKQATLRFKSYSLSSSGSEAPLYLLNGNPYNLGFNVSATSIALYYNNSVPQTSTGAVTMSYTVSSTTTTKNFISTTNNFASTSSASFNFYINGVMFNKMRLLTFTETNKITVNSSTSTAGGSNSSSPYSLDQTLTNISFTGIQRPNISQFNSNYNLEAAFETNNNEYLNIAGDNNINMMNDPSSLINKIDLGFNLGIGNSNLIGITMSSMSSSSNFILTNSITNEVVSSGSSELKYKLFLVDNIIDTTSNWVVKISNERNTDMYKADTSGSLVIELTIPGYVPLLSTISMSSVSFGTNTNCGYILSNNISINCGRGTESNTINCLLIDGVMNTNKISIACYYITSGNDPLVVNSLSVDYYKFNGNASYSAVQELVFDSIVSTPTSESGANLFTYDTNQDKAIKVADSNDIVAKINQIFYQQSKNIGGMGVLWMKIELPTSPKPDLKLVIEGNFSKYALTDIQPSCFFTYSNKESDFDFLNKDEVIFYNYNDSKDLLAEFPKYGTDFNQGDFLVDSCYVSGFSSSSGKISLLHKNLIYKFKESLDQKILYLRLSPVIVVDPSTEENSSLKYTITGNLLTSNDLVISDNLNNVLTTSNLIENSYSTSGGTLSYQSKTLCPAIVNLNLSGLELKFTFLFDTNTTSKVLSTYATKGIYPNEVTIFWDLTKFKFSHNTYCMYKDKISYCSVDYYTGIMNIYLNDQQLELKNTTDPIYVIGVVSTSFSASDLNFPCSINNIYYNSNNEKTRLNLLVGSGIISSSSNVIFMSTTESNNGALLIYNISETKNTNELIPRKTSVIKYRIIPTNKKTISGTPHFIFTLPKQYSLYLYQEKTITISFAEYEYDTDYANVEEVLDKSNPTITVNNIEVVGNTIIVQTSNTSITIGTRFAYYEVTIATISNPYDNTKDLNKEISTVNHETKGVTALIDFSTADGYGLIITNNANTAVLRTFDNNSSFITESIQTSNDSRFLHNIENYKGYTFKFSYETELSRFELYFSSSLIADSPKNVILVKAGRYVSISANLNTTDVTYDSLVSSVIYLNKSSSTDSSSSFNTEKEYYLLANYGIATTNILIGTSCSTLPSIYLISFEYDITMPTSVLRTDDTSSSTEEYQVLTYFFPMDKIKVLVSNSPGILKLYSNSNYIDSNLIASSTVLEGSKLGGLMVFYSLDDYIFENSIISWTNISDSKSNNIQFYPGVIYKLKNKGHSTLHNSEVSAAESQKFEMDLSDPNGDVQLGSSIPTTSYLDEKISKGSFKMIGCFKPEVNTVTISFDKVISAISYDNVRDSFAYLSPSDTNNKDLLLTDILFWYTPKALKTYLFCSLSCYSADFPSDSDLTQYIEHEDTEFIQYRQLYVTVKETYSIKFENLLLDQNYKLKCIVQNVNNNETEADKRVVEFTWFNNVTTLNMSIETPSRTYTTCLTYEFSEIPETVITNNILNRFQREFISNGLDTSGCVVAVDEDGMHIKGFDLPNPDTCNLKFEYDHYKEFVLPDQSDLASQIENEDSSETEISSTTETTTDTSTIDTSTTDNTTGGVTTETATTLRKTVNENNIGRLLSNIVSDDTQFSRLNDLKNSFYNNTITETFLNDKNNINFEYKKYLISYINMVESIVNDKLIDLLGSQIDLEILEAYLQNQYNNEHKSRFLTINKELQVLLEMEIKDLADTRNESNFEIVYKYKREVVYKKIKMVIRGLNKKFSNYFGYMKDSDDINTSILNSGNITNSDSENDIENENASFPSYSINSTKRNSYSNLKVQYNSSLNYYDKINSWRINQETSLQSKYYHNQKENKRNLIENISDEQVNKILKQNKYITLLSKNERKQLLENNKELELSYQIVEAYLEKKFLTEHLYDMNNNHITNFISNQIRFLQTAEEIEEQNKKKYMICGVQKITCKTLFTVSYSDHITEITNLSLKASEFKLNFAPDIEVTNFVQHSVFSDSNTPELDTITKTTFEFNSTYYLNIVLTSPNPFICYYRIQALMLGTVPTLSDMICDYDITYRLVFCGVVKSNENGYKNTIQLLENLLEVKNYEIYYVCFNDIIGAYNPSSIGKLGEFAFSTTGEVCEDNCIITDTSETTSDTSTDVYCDPDVDNSCNAYYIQSLCNKILFVILIMAIIPILF